MLSKLYPEYIKSILSFKESDDSLLLKFTSLEDENGNFYLGEVNNIGFKQGRGYLIYPNKTRRYIGNFENNMKNGQGALFSDDKNKEYVGNFINDKMSGEGCYYLKNGTETKRCDEYFTFEKIIYIFKYKIKIDQISISASDNFAYFFNLEEKYDPNEKKSKKFFIYNK